MGGGDPQAELAEPVRSSEMGSVGVPRGGGEGVGAGKEHR